MHLILASWFHHTDHGLFYWVIHSVTNNIKSCNMVHGQVTKLSFYVAFNQLKSPSAQEAFTMLSLRKLLLRATLGSALKNVSCTRLGISTEYQLINCNWKDSIKQPLWYLKTTWQNNSSFHLSIMISDYKTNIFSVDSFLWDILSISVDHKKL